MRVDFDELMETMIAAPMGERVSIRHTLEVIVGIDILQMTIGKRRMAIRVSTEALDLTSLSKHVFVLNKRELEIFTIQNTASGGDRVVDLVYAAKAEAQTVDETKLRDAAEIAFAIVASGERYDRYARKGEPPVRPVRSDDPLVRSFTKTCAPTSVLVEDEDPDRLMFLTEKLRGQCDTGPKRSVRVGTTDRAYTDRQSAKV